MTARGVRIADRDARHPDFRLDKRAEAAYRRRMNLDLTRSTRPTAAGRPADPQAHGKRDAGVRARPDRSYWTAYDYHMIEREARALQRAHLYAGIAMLVRYVRQRVALHQRRREAARRPFPTPPARLVR